jgi:uncharacterized protein YcbK (DUF882 family)
MKNARFGIVFVFLCVLPARAADRGDGEITFYTFHLKESATVRYREDGRYVPEALKRIETIFRSRDSDGAMPVDPKLIELIDRIEDRFGVRQVEIISGYRSTAFNKELKATGHAVANESFHTKARAADIHLDEITEEALRDYAESLRIGGVGFYPSLHMVHVDVGPVRTWGEPAPRKAWVGEKNDEAPVTITVAPDRSVGKKRLDSLKVEGGEIEESLDIEYFERDGWARVGACGVLATSLWDRMPLRCEPEFEKLPWGKFRLKARVKGRPDVHQYSNEFYFKRI